MSITLPGSDTLLTSVAETGALADQAMSASSQRASPLDLSGRAVLLALDVSAGEAAGALVARALAAKYHARVHVVSVVDTRSAPIPPLDIAVALDDEALNPGMRTEQVQEVRAALSAATGSSVDWPVRIMRGTPAAAIIQEARHLNAVLIIVGLRHHGPIDRVVNDETVLNVMREAPCPVLAVAPGTTELPTRVLAAVDFSAASLSATRAARALVGDGAVLVLAYVPPLSAQLPDDGESVIHALGVEAGFAATVRELGEDGIAFDHVVLHHTLPRPPAQMLLEYAEGATIDLIAAGSARHGRLDRWLLGSVSTDLVRDGRRSVLIVPPVAAARQR